MRSRSLASCQLSLGPDHCCRPPALPRRSARTRSSEEVRKYVAVDTAVVALTNVLLVDGTGARAAAGADGRHPRRPDRRGGPGGHGARAGGRAHDGSRRAHGHPRHRRHARPPVLHRRGRPRGADVATPGRGSTSARASPPSAPPAAARPTPRSTSARTSTGAWCPGPRIHLTAPYLTGAEGGGSMAVVNSPEAARRFVAYWARGGRHLDQGVHRHPPRRAGRRDQGGAQARREGHRAPLLGQLPRGGGAGHRQPGARDARPPRTSIRRSSPTSARSSRSARSARPIPRARRRRTSSRRWSSTRSR